MALGLLLSGNTYTEAKNFDLREVSDKNAVCNNGKLATYHFAKNDSDKWLIQLEGGGSGWPAKFF